VRRNRIECDARAVKTWSRIAGQWRVARRLCDSSMSMRLRRTARVTFSPGCRARISSRPWRRGEPA